MDDGRVGIRGYDDPDFDPFATYDRSHGWEAVDNPYEKIAALRSAGSVHLGGFREAFGSPPDKTLAHLEHFSVYGFDEVSRSLFDAALFSNSIYEHNLGRGFGRSITTMDPPEHPRYRRLFQLAFLPRQIATWGNDHVVPVVHALIDKFADRGEAELVSEFTLHYPFHFIYRQLGLPKEDVETFHALAVGLLCVLTDMEHGMEAHRKLGDYFLLLLEQRRKRPGTDLVSKLVTAEVAGERLPDEIIIAFLRQLLNAGGDTTFRATGSTLAGLLSSPEQLQALRGKRDLMAQTISEGLRWEPPTTAVSRTPTQTTDLGGVMVSEGAALDIVVAGANRDPKVFADPDRFDIFRAQTRNFTFGYGMHVCIGQYLAQLEMSVALGALLDRLPRVRLDDRRPPPRIVGLTKRSPERLWVRFD